MNYSNPVTYFVTGNDQESFTFFPLINPKFFYVQVRTGRYIPISVLIPAADSKDAKRLLKAAMKFKIKCSKKYIIHSNNRKYQGLHYPEYRSREINNIIETQKIINAIDDNKVIVQQITPNQLFKVGWACNDTL